MIKSGGCLTNATEYIFSHESLCRKIQYDTMNEEADLHRVVMVGRGFSLHEQERAEYLMNSAAFKTWFTDPESRLKMVQANGETEILSPASFACGLLASVSTNVEPSSSPSSAAFTRFLWTRMREQSC